MAKTKKIDSKEVGLDIGLNLFRFFFDSEYMHYGYWEPGMEVKAVNLKKAQENYTRYLFSHIPKGVKSILDVGCGSGKVAEELVQAGYRVSCVSPPSMLTSRAAERLDGMAEVAQSTFEGYSGGGKFDLILFSESYQYIDLEKGFRQSFDLLNPGGTMLLCDFFQTDAEGVSPLGGGHRLAEFYRVLSEQPFTTVKDLDITDYTAPTMTLVNQLTMEVALPSILLLAQLAQDRYPLAYRFLTWRMRKKIEKNRKKHFEGRRNAENFKKFKSYRLVLLRKTD